MSSTPVEVTLYRWAGSWGPFKIRIPCGECSLTVDGKLVSQGHALNRGVLTEAVIAAHVQRTDITGSHLFGKATCPHCVRAKNYLVNASIEYIYHDVVREPRALYEMLGRVKPIVGPTTPITVPQIWADGVYVGSADQLQ